MQNKQIAELLQNWHERIKKQGLSRRQFCKMFDISYDTYKRLKNPTIYTMQKIENGLLYLESK